jgi:hypothetical protein
VLHAQALYYSDVFGSGGTRDQVGGASCLGEFTVEAGEWTSEIIVRFTADGCSVG